MKQKKVPMRMCTVTREKLEKKDLLRVVRTPEGQFVVDETGRQNGKGAYVKKDLEVIKKAQKNKVLDRVFESEIPEDIYMKLMEIVNE